VSSDNQKTQDNEIQIFLEALNLQFGFDFRDYAKASIRRRVLDLLPFLECQYVSEMTNKLFRRPELLSAVISQLSVPLTDLYRDVRTFHFIGSEILPVLQSYPRLNIWIAGCSTGEEAYSLAILLHEHNILDRSMIYATDINEVSLRQAEEAVYPLNKMEQWHEQYLLAGGARRLSNYYTARYKQAIFSRHLTQHISFAFHNMVADGVFCETQLIMCRNVLIYFSKALQDRCLELFSESLVRKGFLILGEKERLLSSTSFQLLLKDYAIYQKV
jgi:chemotaxis protein methyltransferase CheR